MKVISTANQIGQAFKNAGRVREILGVFAAAGFADLMHRMKLSKFLPAKVATDESQALPVAARLRISFEKLGPSFVKLGQLMASRPDFIPEDFVDELQKLQDRVSAIPFSEIRETVEKELGRPLSEVFLEFDETPLAAASIAQVHQARLRTGEAVAVKIQRPGIDRILENDISILRGIARLLENHIPELRTFNPVGLVDEFFHSILYELDFRVEANNIRKIKANLVSLKRIAVPEVYLQYSTSKILVLEKFEGIRFSDRQAILAKGIDPKDIVEAGADAFFHMVMRNGLFHGDLHAGNLFVLNDGRIGIIDFGIVGRLTRKVQDSIITLFIAIMDEDYESLAVEYVTLCQSEGETDIVRLQKDLMDTISPYVGMALGEVNAGRLLLQSTTIAARNHLRVPRELMLLFKAIVTIDGLGKKLDPGFDILQLGNRLAHDLVATRYSKERITRDLIVLGRDLQDTLETFPRLLKRFLRHWSNNNFSIETRNRDLPELIRTVRVVIYHFVATAAGVTLVGLGAFLYNRVGDTYILGIPLVSAVLFVLGLWILGASLWILKPNRK